METGRLFLFYIFATAKRTSFAEAPLQNKCILQGNMSSKWDFNRSLSSTDPWRFYTFCSHSLSLKYLAPPIRSDVRGRGAGESRYLMLVVLSQMLRNKAFPPDLPSNTSFRSKCCNENQVEGKRSGWNGPCRKNVSWNLKGQSIMRQLRLICILMTDWMSQSSGRFYLL